MKKIFLIFLLGYTQCIPVTHKRSDDGGGTDDQERTPSRVGENRSYSENHKRSDDGGSTEDQERTPSRAEENRSDSFKTESVHKSDGGSTDDQERTPSRAEENRSDSFKTESVHKSDSGSVGYSNNDETRTPSCQNNLSKDIERDSFSISSTVHSPALLSPAPDNTSHSHAPSHAPAPAPDNTSHSHAPDNTSHSPAPDDTSPAPDNTSHSHAPSHAPAPAPDNTSHSPAPDDTSPAPDNTSHSHAPAPAPDDTSIAPALLSPAPDNTSHAPALLSPAIDNTSRDVSIASVPNNTRKNSRYGGFTRGSSARSTGLNVFDNKKIYSNKLPTPAESKNTREGFFKGVYRRVLTSLDRSQNTDNIQGKIGISNTNNQLDSTRLETHKDRGSRFLIATASPALVSTDLSVENTREGFFTGIYRRVVTSLDRSKNTDNIQGEIGISNTNNQLDSTRLETHGDRLIAASAGLESPDPTDPASAGLESPDPTDPEKNGYNFSVSFGSNSKQNVTDTNRDINDDKERKLLSENTNSTLNYEFNSSRVETPVQNKSGLILDGSVDLNDNIYDSKNCGENRSYYDSNKDQQFKCNFGGIYSEEIYSFKERPVFFDTGALGSFSWLAFHGIHGFVRLNYDILEWLNIGCHFKIGSLTKDGFKNCFEGRGTFLFILNNIFGYKIPYILKIGIEISKTLYFRLIFGYFTLEIPVYRLINR